MPLLLFTPGRWTFPRHYKVRNRNRIEAGFEIAAVRGINTDETHPGQLSKDRKGARAVQLRQNGPMEGSKRPKPGQTSLIPPGEKGHRDLSQPSWDTTQK